MASILLRSISAGLNRVHSGSRLLNGTLVTSRTCHSYEGDGKTSVSILNREIKSVLMIDGYSPRGFRLNNGMLVVGPIVLFPKSVLSWDIKDAASVTPDSLTAFTILEPKIDILVIGVGDPGHQISKETQQHIRSKGIMLEILPTDHACKTINFLNAEKRCAAAALIPPQTRRLSANEQSFRSKMEKARTDALDKDN